MLSIVFCKRLISSLCIILPILLFWCHWTTSKFDNWYENSSDYFFDSGCFQEFPRTLGKKMKQRTILKKKKLKRKSYKIWRNIHMSGFGIRLFYFETGSENPSVSEGKQTRFAWWAHSGCRSFRCLKVYFGFLRVIPSSTIVFTSSWITT